MTSWAEETTLQIGQAIREARGAHSAQWLADRTAELGSPISRTAISEYETGKRKSMPVADLLILAAALEVPPVLLLYPNAPDGRVEALPGANCSSDTAVQWFAGEALTPQKPREDGVTHIKRSSNGAKLLDAIRKRRDFTSGPLRLFDLIDKGGQGDELSGETRTALQEWREEVAKLNAEIRHLGGTVDDG